ncbi:hypothetical protein WJX82_001731 [Trebouxia sp. C0006]
MLSEKLRLEQLKCPHRYRNNQQQESLSSEGTKPSCGGVSASGWQVRLTRSTCLTQDHSCAGRGGTDPVSGKAVLGRLLLVAN